MFPPDFLPPEDLDAEDFLDDPPLDLLAEDFFDPELAFDADPEFDFLAEEPDLLPLPFLDFSAAGLPPPDGAPPPPPPDPPLLPPPPPPPEPPPIGVGGGAIGVGVCVGGLTLAAKRKPLLKDLKSGWLGS